MPNSRGLRHKTRQTFTRGFRNHGPIHLSTYLTPYKVGDLVDIKTNSSVQKGMPFKYYHGKTARVWNVSRRSLGVEVGKIIRNRVIVKRLHIRAEHIRPSRSREDFVKRIAGNEKLIAEARKTGVRAKLAKRAPSVPKGGRFVSARANAPEDLHAIPYELVA
eukprot:TRINITY_DN7542_c0_g2_i1.p1 TRINITY_DN7542_c0_g2~~TRINITY_DN7542_c0_g2_i1.p1  ORF type:complete len:179 (-),score=30.42 TRINITY_DN7542_c0_g2_i1:153-638(-)